MTPGLAVTDPLPSWTESPAKHAIVTFVARVATPGSKDFLPPPERVAVFDNDGTLWAEQPAYVETVFASERPGALGGTSERFEWNVLAWIAIARNPLTGRRYTEMVYQPQLELLAYLRANGFAVFVVTGSDAAFVRAWSERVYGIPRERVIGSRPRLTYEVIAGYGEVVRARDRDLAVDGPGKPVGIEQGIGRRPILAFGNSDGDYEMLEYTTTPPGARLGLILHHTDAVREWAYDRTSRVGRLSRALDDAPARGWIVVDMRRDWRVVFPPGPAVRHQRRASGRYPGAVAVSPAQRARWRSRRPRPYKRSRSRSSRNDDVVRHDLLDLRAFGGDHLWRDGGKLRVMGACSRCSRMHLGATHVPRTNPTAAPTRSSAECKDAVTKGSRELPSRGGSAQANSAVRARAQVRARDLSPSLYRRRDPHARAGVVMAVCRPASRTSRRARPARARARGSPAGTRRGCSAV
jgi:hypothetical protein